MLPQLYGEFLDTLKYSFVCDGFVCAKSIFLAHINKKEIVKIKKN